MDQTIEKVIRDALHELCDGKRNQNKICEDLGISHSYLNRLLSGKRSISGLSLNAITKMFPKASIHLYGDHNITQSNVSVNNGSTNSISINSDKSAVDSFRLRAMDAIISLDIPSESLQLVLKTLKETKG